MRIGDIFISSLKLMNDTIGGSRPTVEILAEYAEDSDYQDRIYQMTDAINRGLMTAGVDAYIPYNLKAESEPLIPLEPSTPIDPDKPVEPEVSIPLIPLQPSEPFVITYNTAIEDAGICKDIALAIPYYVKYELYQDDNAQQAYGAREEFERLVIAAKALDKFSRQDKIVNVFGEVT